MPSRHTSLCQFFISTSVSTQCSAHADLCAQPVSALCAPQAALGPLDPFVTGMDPVERAMRLGEDRDTVKEKEDPR